MNWGESKFKRFLIDGFMISLGVLAVIASVAILAAFALLMTPFMVAAVVHSYFDK
jgi:hypothetical protein